MALGRLGAVSVWFMWWLAMLKPLKSLPSALSVGIFGWRVVAGEVLRSDEKCRWIEACS